MFELLKSFLWLVEGRKIRFLPLTLFNRYFMGWDLLESILHHKIHLLWYISCLLSPRIKRKMIFSISDKANFTCVFALFFSLSGNRKMPVSRKLGHVGKIQGYLWIPRHKIHIVTPSLTFEIDFLKNSRNF